jgi:cytochrome c biogenesis protein ResB
MDFEGAGIEPPAPIKEEKEGIGIFELLWLAILDIPNIMRTLKFAVIIIIILALFTLAGTILPQEKFASSPQEFTAQYKHIFSINPDDGISFKEALYYGVVEPLELYRVFDSNLYFTLLCVLSISSVICAYDRIFLTKRIYKNKRPKVSERVIDSYRFTEKSVAPGAIQDVAEKVRTRLKALKFEVFEDSDSSGKIWFFARKNTFKYIASLIFHFAIVGIFLGGVAGNERVFGFNDIVFIQEGDAQPVANDLHLMKLATEKGEQPPAPRGEFIELEEYYNVYREREFKSIDEYGFPESYGGFPSDFYSKVKVYRKTPSGDDETIKELTVEVNVPLKYSGINYYQSSIASRIVLEIVSPDGVSQFVQGFTNESVQIPISIQGLGMPVVTFQTRDLVGGYWEKLDGTREELPHVVRLVDYRPMQNETGPPALLGYISEDKRLEVDGWQIKLDRIDEFTGLQYAYDPGVEVVTISVAILLAGIFITMYWPFRSTRILLTPDKSGTGYLVGGNVSDIVDQINESLIGTE